MNANVLVHRLLEAPAGSVDGLLQAFVDLPLQGAPRFEVAHNVACNDVDAVGGPLEHLPVAVVSYDTMQKYIVPRGDVFLVPVPVADNWHIYRLTQEQLQAVIEQLAGGGSLEDFYRLAAEGGVFWRRYYA